MKFVKFTVLRSGRFLYMLFLKGQLPRWNKKVHYHYRHAVCDEL